MTRNLRAADGDRTSTIEIASKMEDDVLAIRDFADAVDRLTQLPHRGIPSDLYFCALNPINRLAGEILKRATALQQDRERLLHELMHEDRGLHLTA